MAHYDPERFRALSFHDAAARFRRGEDAPSAYLARCLATIEEREAVVRAWTARRPQAVRAEAGASDQRYRAGRPLSGIDGLPIGIKDLIATRDLPTGEGIAGNAHAMTGFDAPCVQALRAAGALIVGKLVTTELGQGRPGPTTNPFDPARTPGGSSMGCAAAVGARMLPVAIGSQLGGSVIRPAALCGNVGFKPSFGALRRGDRVACSHAVLGLHAGCLEDAWLVAWEIAARSGGDPGHRGLEGPAAIHPVAPRCLAVLRTTGWAVADAQALQGFERLLDRLRSQGVHVLRPGEEPALDALEAALAQTPRVAAVIAGFEQRWHLEALALRHRLSDAILAQLDRARSLTLADYRQALGQRAHLQALHRQLAARTDAAITLACTGPAGTIAGPHDDPWQPGAVPATGNPAFNLPASVLGAPALSLPLLAVRKMPVGVQLVGLPGHDHALVCLGRWLMQALHPDGGREASREGAQHQ